MGPVSFQQLGSAIWLAEATTASYLWRLLLLQDYNTRVVLVGTLFLGFASGILGVFLLLRQRVLIGDAISHACLPGVVVAYMLVSAVGGEKSKLFLLSIAAVSGAIGGLVVLGLRHLARIREDAALGIVLSVFFGAGVSLLTLAQTDGGNIAGLEGFIYGKVAAMTMQDVWINIVTCGVVVLVCFGLRKEFSLLCFDSSLARTQGWPILGLDSLLIGLVVLVTIVGLQAVGIILVIALQVIPAASARFWTNDLFKTLWISGTLGACSSVGGTIASSVFEDLPSGAMIVLSACVAFAFSFAFGSQRGVVWRLARQVQMRRLQELHHVLRSAYELLESEGAAVEQIHALQAGDLKSSRPFSIRSLSAMRQWSESMTRTAAMRAAHEGMLVMNHDQLRLTPRGMLKAVGVVRDHRLLERYMIDEAAAKASEADRVAD